LGNNPSADSVMLLDKEFFPIEVIPTWALTADLSVYEPYMAAVVSSPESISDPRPRMFIPPVKEGQAQQLIFIRPILTANNSLSQPFQVDGLLLVEINIEKLIQAIIAKHPGDYALVRLLNNDQILYQQPPAEPGKLARHQTNILLGLGNQSLILEVGRPVEGIFAGIVVAYRTQVIVVFLFIVLMLVVIKKLADKLVRPLQLLSEVTTSMSNHNFQQRSAIVVDPKKIHYREFSEVFELLRDMEHIINEQFQQLHEANATLEEKVTERTEALKNNIQLLDWQRGALQQLVQYAMQVHQGCALNELGALSHELAERIAQQACGLYLLRSELFAGYEYWSGLSAAHKLLLQQNQAQLNDHSSLLALMQNNPGLQLFPVGGSGDGYQGFFITERSAHSEQAGEALMVLSTMLSSALSQHKLTAKLQQLAHMDSVTGLPNRHFFNARYSDKVARFDAANSESHFGVVVIDANGLKTVNDKYGHQCGDEMLRVIAQALKQSVRANDTVARVGGDEFCIIVESADSAMCAAFAERLQAQCSQLQLDVGEKTIAINFSMGYACTDQDSLKNLLALADERMYFAKKKHYAQLSPHLSH